MELSVLTFEGLRRARNLHPVFVHFPLALLPTSFLFYAIGFRWKRRDYLFAGRSVLLLTMASTALAWFTGFRAVATLGISVPKSAVLNAHLAFGSVLTAMTVFLFAWSRAHLEDVPKHRWAFLAFLGAAVGFSLLTGDLGARLVYEKGTSVHNPPIGGPTR